jgi:hypothetical protein
MNDETPPASGNRWEPTDQPVQPVAAPGPIPEYAVAEPVARTPWLSRARTAVAGGAAAVLIAGGLGGFAVGRATAGGGDDQVRFDQQSGPPGFERDGDVDPDDGGRGFDGPGLAPGQGSDSDSDGTDSQDS